MTARRLGALMAAGIMIALSACSNTASTDSTPSPMVSTRAPATSPTGGVGSYVAMGDSYVSGLGIDPVDDTSGDCYRSRVNWPSILSKRLQVQDFRDVSCAGATTGHLTASFPSSDGTVVPAQVDALSKDTQVVTLGIGGNDEGMFGALVGSCSAALNKAQDACTPFITQKLPSLLGTVKDNVTKALLSVRHQAPSAQVLLVGYLRVLPDRRGCERAGIAGRTAVLASRGEKALDDALAAAAKDADVEFVSLRRMASGHDACSGSRAWVNGIHPTAGDGVLLHPNAAGMRAVARAVAARLGRPPR